jgi:hypothetical protein
MKALKLTINEWQRINVEIAKHHPRSVWMVRTKMRKVLGFTPREHQEWNENRGYRTMIHLDFYDESQRTMFLLKYGDFMGKEDDNRLY